MKGIDICKQYLGLEENKDRKQIMSLLNSKAYHGDIAIDPVTTSWCSAWINFCERSVGKTTLGRLNALSWEAYGQEVAEGDEQEGDIVTFQWDSEKGTGHGHVTYFIDWHDDTDTVKCLGGNQDNQVKYSFYPQHSIRHIRRNLMK